MIQFGKNILFGLYLFCICLGPWDTDAKLESEVQRHLGSNTAEADGGVWAGGSLQNASGVSSGKVEKGDLPQPASDCFPDHLREVPWEGLSVTQGKEGSHASPERENVCFTSLLSCQNHLVTV